MSNVIKMTDAQQAAAGEKIAKWIAGSNDAKGTKKESMGKWKKLVEEQGDKLFGRMYDQIRLTDEEAEENNIPEEFSDCSILAVISRLMVTFAASRNVLTPSALITFVQYQIDLEKKMMKEEEQERKE